MTRYAVDARLNAYRTGGIATYTRALISAMETLLQPHDLLVLEHRRAAQPLSRHFPRRALWTPPHHRLERIALAVELLPHRLHLLHSPDFIPPHTGAKRRVITVHDLTFLHFPETLTPDSRRYYNGQIRAAVRAADHILTVSESSARDLVTMLGVPRERITVTLEGYDPALRPLDDATLERGLASLWLPRTYFLHVGTWEPRKNLARLAQGYRLLLDAIPDAPPLVLAGRPGWNFEQTRDAIDALHIPDGRLLWRSDFTDEDLVTVYNGCLCTITPSLYEGFGLPVLEGMACGRPPLVSDRSALPETAGGVGLSFDPLDPSQIAAAMQRTLTDSAWMASQREAALARAAQFSWRTCAQQTLAVYQSL